MGKPEILFVAEQLAKEWNDFFLKEPIDILSLGRFLLDLDTKEGRDRLLTLGEQAESLLVCVGDSIWSLLDRDLTKILEAAGYEFSTLREYSHLASQIPISKHYTLESLEALKLQTAKDGKSEPVLESLKATDKKLKHMEESVYRPRAKKKVEPSNISVSKGLKEDGVNGNNDDESEEFDD